MKRTFILPVLLVILVMVVMPGCLEDKVLEIVLTGETSMDFSQDEDSANWTNSAQIDLAQEIRDILTENGYSADDILEAHVTSVSYGVTRFSHSHDWEIGGQINVTVTTMDSTLTGMIVDYPPQSVQAALGRKISVQLEPDGVAAINYALEVFLAGDNPVLTFTVMNDTVTPLPSTTDRMVFDWRAWLAIQLIVRETVEVPDPF